MKKIMIIIVSVVYFLSIILVAFLGYQAEIHGLPIYAQDIVLTYEAFPYYYIENGAIIYTVTQNANYNPESEDPNNHYKYTIKFNEFDYFYETHANYQIPAMPVSTEGDVTDKTMSYLIDKDKKDFVEVDDNGVVTFKQYLKTYTFACSIKSQDGGNAAIAIRFTW